LKFLRKIIKLLLSLEVCKAERALTVAGKYLTKKEYEEIKEK